MAHREGHAAERTTRNGDADRAFLWCGDLFVEPRGSALTPGTTDWPIFRPGTVPGLQTNSSGMRPGRIRLACTGLAGAPVRSSAPAVAPTSNIFCAFTSAARLITSVETRTGIIALA